LTILGYPDFSLHPICRWDCHMNGPAYFEIQADDPQRVIGFYTAVRGWGFTKVTGLPIALEKFAVPGSCWQGSFLDPEGNTFGLFQVDKNVK
jgi:predicted enzyme related to lactoylglutathione lyase